MGGQVGGRAGWQSTKRRPEMDTISVQFMLHGAAAAAITIASCLSCNLNVFLIYIFNFHLQYFICS